MKKMLVLALALVFILSGAVMAQQYSGIFENPFRYDEVEVNGEWVYQGTDFADDTDPDTPGDQPGDYAGYEDKDFNGLVYFNEIDRNNPGKYTNLESFNRSGYYDVNTANSDKQSVEIKLNVEAYIPCFLEMKLTGNQGTTSAISYGPNAHGATTATNYLMVFDNELGGYLDENWQSLGYGSNVAINPGDDVFIGACDIFAVEVFSNDKYRYAVESASLEGSGGANGERLSMYMRSDVGTGWLGSDTIFNNTTAAEKFSLQRNAGVKLEALHNFKVPFSMDTVHGKYTGNVVFRAATI